MRWLWALALVLALTAAEVPATENALVENAKQHPASFAANRHLAEYYIRHNQILAALPWLEKARSLNAADYDNSYDLALAWLETGNPRGARKLVLEMLSQQDRAELHNLLGDVEEAEGQVQEAAEQYERAARLDPSEKNLFDLGTDLMRHRGFEPAVKVFLFATQRYPHSARLRVGLGTAYYSTGQYDEAVETLCQAVDLAPTDTRALDFLGKMYDVSPRFAGEVTKRLDHFARVYPGNAAASYYYALSLRKRALTPGPDGSSGEAEKLLLRAVRLNPNYAEAHLELGLLYEDEKQESRAIEQYEAVIRIHGADVGRAHYRLGRLYQREGQTALARKEFDAFEALQGKP